MEKCKHVSKIRPAWDHSILNPEKWLCYLCRTTESVWACLSCSNVACGRFNEKHALKHFQESKHPISIEVNEKYVYCYACDDYVLNDNAAGDIKLLRSALSAIATQKFTDIESRGRRLLRSYSHSGAIQREEADDDDKLVTADWHHRQHLLSKVLNGWKLVVKKRKAKERRSVEQLTELNKSSGLLLKKRSIIPGVTGLKNLGNTCYMNSVLQVLSHIESFREFFLKMRYSFDASPDGSPHVKLIGSIRQPVIPPPAAKQYARQTTVECFQHLMSDRKIVSPKQKKKQIGGLNGGSTQSTQTPVKQLICDVESCGKDNTNISLCGELHGLFRVLWSGKWAQVSPHAFLRSVWQAIPMFKGYAQHDAQEFLCELLDKIQRELDSTPGQPSSLLLDNLFLGQLVSRVICQSCGNISETFEPYMDLSLEFPNRYQITKQNSRVAEDICHITEMLAKFTEEESLEGNIYACEKCNKGRSKSSGTIYTEAKKQLLINKLPPILRLHLKRFRWSGRIHREKISTHVATDELLDLKPFCSNTKDMLCQYELFGVIIHHGRGFGSGHYTAYTWNNEADSWVNCNDSRMILSSLDDVLTAQAYILFYKTVNTNTLCKSLTVSSDSSTDTIPYSLKSEDTVCLLEKDQTKSPKTSLSSSSPTKVPKNRQSSEISLNSSSSTLPCNSFYSSSSLSSTSSSFKSEKLSLKSDGTEILSADEMEGLDDSFTLNSFFQVVDKEISFNFKSSNDSLEKKTKKSSSKRSLDRSLKRSKQIPSSKRKKLSFDLAANQCNNSNSDSQGKESNNVSKHDKNKTEKLTRRRTRSMKLEKDTKLLQLEKFIGRSHAEDEISKEGHIKRRKSTFW
ncbi:Ubiquitin carboxyl-terminal hydrolase 49 [Mactra antiquata]